MLKTKLTVLIAVVLIAILSLLILADIDSEQTKEDILEPKAEEFGLNVISAKGLQGEYYLFDWNWSGGCLYTLKFRNETMQIEMDIIYWETTDDFSLVTGTFGQNLLEMI